MKKTVAVITAACFFISIIGVNVSFSAPVSAAPAAGAVGTFAPETAHFDLPQNYGRVTSAKYNGSDTVILQIQDLHANPEVQKNIKNIISYFDDKYGIKNVYTEGAWGDVDVSWLADIKDNNLKTKAIENLTNAGKLTGGELYALNVDRQTDKQTDKQTDRQILKGLENKDAYIDNLKRYAGMLDSAEEVGSILQDVSKDIAKLSDRYLNKFQKRNIKLFADYYSGKIPDEKFFTILNNICEKFSININAYDNISTYLYVLDASRKINRKKLNKEFKAFIELAKNNLSYGDFSKLSQLTGEFSENFEQILQFPEVKQLVSGQGFENLRAFLRLSEAQKYINSYGLLEEQKSLISIISSLGAQDISQREVAFLVSFFKVYKDYLLGQITADDYEYYKNYAALFKKLYAKFMFDNKLALLLPYEQTSDKYYEVNMLRNEYFIENCGGVKDAGRLNINYGEEVYNDEDKIVNSLENAKNISVVITGGFHTQDLSRLLAENKISYIVLTPNIGSDYKETGAVYARMIQEQNSILFSALAALNMGNFPEAFKIIETITAVDISNVNEMNKMLKELLPNYANVENAKFEKNGKTLQFTVSVKDENGTTNTKVYARGKKGWEQVKDSDMQYSKKSLYETGLVYGALSLVWAMPFLFASATPALFFSPAVVAVLLGFVAVFFINFIYKIALAFTIEKEMGDLEIQVEQSKVIGSGGEAGLNRKMIAILPDKTLKKLYNLFKDKEELKFEGEVKNGDYRNFLLNQKNDVLAKIFRVDTEQILPAMHYDTGFEKINIGLKWMASQMDGARNIIKKTSIALVLDHELRHREFQKNILHGRFSGGFLEEVWVSFFDLPNSVFLFFFNMGNKRKKEKEIFKYLNDEKNSVFSNRLLLYSFMKEVNYGKIFSSPHGKELLKKFADNGYKGAVEGIRQILYDHAKDNKTARNKEICKVLEDNFEFAMELLPELEPNYNFKQLVSFLLSDEGEKTLIAFVAEPFDKEEYQENTINNALEIKKMLGYELTDDARSLGNERFIRRILSKHYDIMKNFTLQSLRDKDLGRHNTQRDTIQISDDLKFNYTLTHTTPKTLALLSKLVAVQDLTSALQKTMKLEKTNKDENRETFHYMGRFVNFERDTETGRFKISAKPAPYFFKKEDNKAETVAEANRAQKEYDRIMNGGNGIVPTLNKIQSVADEIRNEKREGVVDKVSKKSKPIKTIIVVAVGGSILGTESILGGLKRKKDDLRYEIVRDEQDLNEVINALQTNALDPASTLIMAQSKSFKGDPIFYCEQLLDVMCDKLDYEYSKQGFRTDETLKVLDKHFLGVTDLEDKGARNNIEKFGISEDNRFHQWSGIGGRFSSWSPITALPVSVILGFDVYTDYLQGASAIDEHMINSMYKADGFKNNIPVVLASIWEWYLTYYQKPVHKAYIMSSFLQHFAEVMQQLNDKSLAKSVREDGNAIESQDSFAEVNIVDVFNIKNSGLDSAIFRPDSFANVGDMLFFQDDLEMKNVTNLLLSAMSGTIQKIEEDKEKDIATQLEKYGAKGNTPITVVAPQKQNAYSLGMLVALYEYCVMVQGHMRGINSAALFSRPLEKELKQGERIRTELFDPNITAITGSMFSDKKFDNVIITENYDKSATVLENYTFAIERISTEEQRKSYKGKQIKAIPGIMDGYRFYFREASDGKLVIGLDWYGKQVSSYEKAVGAFLREINQNTKLKEEIAKKLGLKDNKLSINFQENVLFAADIDDAEEEIQKEFTQSNNLPPIPLPSMADTVGAEGIFNNKMLQNINAMLVAA